MRKAKNSQPWTRRKLHRFRKIREQVWAEGRAEEQALTRWLEASSRRIDKMTEGCNGAI